MKKQISKKVFAFIPILIGMFSFSFVNGQTCNGNKIRVYHCYRSGCASKCVNPNNIPSGWSPFGCGNCPGTWRQAESISTDETLLTDVFPNPVSQSATILFSLEQSGKVSIKVFDMTGRIIKTLADGLFMAGENKIEWDVENENPGIYFLSMEAGDYSQTEKLSVIQ